ncbi:uncharacterized protein P174DRAFT_286655 [Aspergillus novofumigatus IBT 16806]|uniref:Uncharacterized protein n=1 Tax=Aspergillus novofumigatus (strain IBT 16806) TaxID=1392255 RepID=A0A2I1C0X1_ASPN1|nr:uncharacterized protein P174DRAFT_286655 [Aspergillus novofumigatus IBT 16806]PKX91269.1 hypothetical protein P174DRAFT_286655 [Aspergillus novofumigatus IBT 16806]
MRSKLRSPGAQTTPDWRRLVDPSFNRPIRYQGVASSPVWRENMANSWISDEHLPGLETKSLAIDLEQSMRCFAQGLGFQEDFFKCQSYLPAGGTYTMRLLHCLLYPGSRMARHITMPRGHADWEFSTLYFRKKDRVYCKSVLV